MDLDFDKYCIVESSPTTVLIPPPWQHSNISDRKSDGYLVYKNQRSTTSCKDFRYRAVANEPLASQGFNEVSVGREKIDFSGQTQSAFSFGIIDSLCSSDEYSSLVHQKRQSSVMSLPKPCKSQIERDRDADDNIQKPFSSLLSLSHSPATSEGNGSLFSSSPKFSFSPVRKILSPFAKSMSHRSPLSGFRVPINHSNMLDDYRQEWKVTCDLEPQISPAHLHGFLIFRNKHRMPVFEFLVESTQDIYVTKACKVHSAVDSIYTFHSLRQGRNAHASGRGCKDSYQESLSSSTVAQMHVSWHRRREFDSNSEMSNSLVTEFVLHDVLHSGKSSSSQSHSICSPDYNETLEAGSHSDLEIGAVITQTLFPDSTGLQKGISVNPHPLKMHAVIPAGSHASPTTGSHGPSPLLDRWRSGGGCDCGGWDAACPLIVFSNLNIKMDSRNLAELFVQGKKENAPAFAMRPIEQGKYTVDFHAQLSSLQAFFICIAILHTTEGSLRSVLAEKMKNSTDEGECNKMEGKAPSFVLNPPFSPVARV